MHHYISEELFFLGGKGELRGLECLEGWREGENQVGAFLGGGPALALSLVGYGGKFVTGWQEGSVSYQLRRACGVPYLFS